MRCAHASGFLLPQNCVIQDLLHLQLWISPFYSTVLQDAAADGSLLLLGSLLAECPQSFFIKNFPTASVMLTDVLKKECHTSTKHQCFRVLCGVVHRYERQTSTAAGARLSGSCCRTLTAMQPALNFSKSQTRKPSNRCLCRPQAAPLR